LLKQILSSYAQTCPDYFGMPDKQKHLKHYQEVYLDVQNSASNTLLPYVVLMKVLGDLVS